jgi:RNA polymerase sigma-70 factor, ECF subfamily
VRRSCKQSARNYRPHRALIDADRFASRGLSELTLLDDRMAASRLAQASALAASGVRLAARQNRITRRPGQVLREAAAGRSKPAVAGQGHATRAAGAIEKASLDNGSNGSPRPDKRADRPRRAGENRPAAEAQACGTDRTRISGKSPRDARAPERAAATAPNASWAHEAILAEVPKLRAFAISLCGNLDQADDFVQETLLRAWAHIDQFQRGTNMAAWLFTILRNSLRSNYRKYRREVEDADGSYAERMITQPEQNGRLEFEELRGALAKLPSDQRETLILVVASGASYEEAAEICGCRVGTIKSRVHRARARLAQILAIDSVDDFAPDRAVQAVLGGATLGSSPAG